ncbi:cytidine deaminase-like isoform X1 [Ischnura elegans]|uniref:cytidine deaminase-like isoform X1 n=1 Tax=Ischnura elegans TaxID=197161 RepID=UPI001ED8B236|nr:cytidine deaminase-like isoform X1 [Ischnura elegans]
MASQKTAGDLLPFDALDKTGRELIVAANSARKYAYCPFSKFAVGAAVIWDDSEEIHIGSNIENSSYGNCICAERTALAKGITEGRRRVKAVAVAAEMSDRPDYVSPCGICRQFIYEFGDDVKIYLSKPSDIHGQVLVTSIQCLLPLGFRF